MHTRGSRSKSKCSHSCNQTGKRSRLNRQLMKYSVGDKVVLKVDAGVHKGMFHRRHYGKVGTITHVKGLRSYVIHTGVVEIHTLNAHFKLL